MFLYFFDTTLLLKIFHKPKPHFQYSYFPDDLLMSPMECLQETFASSGFDFAVILLTKLIFIKMLHSFIDSS